MADGSISLLAQTSYVKARDLPRVAVKEEGEYKKAAHFQNMVQEQFNSFAGMSPTQILDKVRAIQSSQTVNRANIPNSGGVVSATRQSLDKYETTVRKSLIDEASLPDLLTTTTEAANTMKTVVEIRNKFLEAFDKVMNMSI